MIVADVRQSLTRADAQLALRLIGRGSASELARAEDALRDDGLDVLLDDPRLLTALVDSRQGAHASLALFTYVATRHALRAAPSWCARISATTRSGSRDCSPT